MMLPKRQTSALAALAVALPTVLVGACVAGPPAGDDPAELYDEAPIAKAATTVVAPLIDSSWAQSGGYAPGFTYNRQAPLVATSLDGRAPVGCIAVAFGQVLRYYGFPKVGVGTHAYCNATGADGNCQESVAADFYRTRYDWGVMPPTLNSLSSAASIDGVSTLLYHIGVAVDTKYGANGSAAKLANPAIIKSFRKHFDMPGIATEYRKDYSEEAWYELITSEIRARRPVVLVGFNAAVDAGHAYILDGIDAAGRVHVNWGWGGRVNGYFDLHSLVTPHGSFTEDLFALVNFTPEIQVENAPCNGVRGLRCEPELSCISNQTNEVIHDFIGSDEAGTCRKGPPEPPEVSAPVVEERSGSVQQNEWLQFGGFSTLDAIEVRMSGDGDADLYVRRGTEPGQRAGEFDCRPYSSGTLERCELTGGGEYFVSVRGYRPASFSLTITTARAMLSQ